jgi:hypothetical protein
MPSNQPRQQVATRNSQQYHPRAGENFRTPKKCRRGDRYQKLYKPLVNVDELHKRKAACRANLRAWLNVDDNDVQQQSTAEEHVPTAESLNETIDQLAAFDDSQIVNMEVEDWEPLIEIADEEHPPERIYNHDLSKHPPRGNARERLLKPYSSITERLYERWEELLPNLTAPLIEYENTMAGNAALPERDIIWENPCTSSSCNPKSTQVICLFWDREHRSFTLHDIALNPPSMRQTPSHARIYRFATAFLFATC